MASAHGQVLLVGDRPASNSSLDIVCTELGQALVRSHGSAEALAQARRTDYALILVAYAGDGPQLLDMVRLMRTNSRSSRTPIVALGLPPQPPFDLEPLYEAGAVAVLTDPLSPTILRAKARFYLDAFADTEERRRAETALADARERLENVIALAELGVWSWDAGTDRVNADPRMNEMFGVADGVGAPLAAYLEALHPDDMQTTRDLVVEAIRTGEPYHATYRIRAGADAWRWVIARGQVDVDERGQPIRLHGVVIDATRQFEAEQQMRANEERYRTVFESLDEGLCVIEMLYDSEGRPCDYRFLEANPAFVKHTGLIDAVGKRMRDLAPAHERHWFDIYGRVADTGEPARFVNEARELGRWYDVYATRIGPARARQVAILFSDITERRRADEQLKRLAADLAETNRLKNEFLATLAHELRNPLAPIRSGLQFMRRARGDSAAIARVQDIMDRQLDHLVNLVDDLLDVARITRGQVELKPEWLDLGKVLSAAVETSMPLIEAARHRLDLRLPPEALALYADPTRLTQVVSNLLNNAARYTPKGGSIVLAAERDGEHAVIAVSDNGIGIAPESLESVFKMFTQVGSGAQRGPGGLGIGLSLVRSLVELHGGRVSADSAGANAGSVFTVRLPLAPAGAPAPPEPDAPAIATAHQGLRVLVVDDNRDAAETLSALLGMMGHTAPVANDGHQALRMIPTFRPHVVFLDIGMPGLSGYEAAAAIRRDPLFDPVRLVALTGWGGDADRARSAEAGFDLHLTKPATMAAIERALAGLAG